VCTGTTGHAEVVQIRFDPKVISYGDLARRLLPHSRPHDAQTVKAMMSGRSIARHLLPFAGTEAGAEESIAALKKAGTWDDPIVTEVQPLKAFYDAGQYHKDLLRAQSHAGVLQRGDRPKVAKARKHYFAKLKKR